MAADGEEELVAQRVTDVRICHQRRGDFSVIYLVRGVVDVFLDPSPRETPGLGFPDWQMATFLCRHTCGASRRLDGKVYGFSVGRRSLRASHTVTKMEQCCIYNINNNEFQRHGAVGS
jgi:hypothetical protein